MRGAQMDVHEEDDNGETAKSSSKRASVTKSVFGELLQGEERYAVMPPPSQNFVCNPEKYEPGFKLEGTCTI